MRIYLTGMTFRQLMENRVEDVLPSKFSFSSTNIAKYLKWKYCLKSLCVCVCVCVRFQMASGLFWLSNVWPH